MNVSTKHQANGPVDGDKHPMDAHVGSRIRLRRILMGLSQEELGSRLAITFQQVQKYERGTNRVSASRLFDIALALEVPVGFFFDDLPAALSEPIIEAASAASALAGGEAPSKDETIELVRAYCSIHSPTARASFRGLVQGLSDEPVRKKSTVG